MDKVRLGFIGTGGIARSHLKRLADVSQAEIAALCDVSEASAGSAVEAFGGTAYTDYRKMIDGEKLDAVYVCV